MERHIQAGALDGRQNERICGKGDTGHGDGSTRGKYAKADVTDPTGMIHADKITDELEAQTALIRIHDEIPIPEQALRISSYVENLGVCPGCLKLVAAEWATQNPEAGTIVGFVRGYTIGLIMGRENPI
jgi:hypothetical protein